MGVTPAGADPRGTAAPSGRPLARRPARQLLARRAILAVPAVLALAGCSRVAELPGLQRLPMVQDSRSAMANSLYWIRGIEGAARTEVVWSRPQAMLQVINPQEAADVFSPGLPAHWLSALTVGDPQVLQASGPFGASGAKQLAQVGRLTRPSAAVAVRELQDGQPLLESVSWTDAADMLPRLGEAVKELYETADDDSLVLKADLQLPPADDATPLLSARIFDSSGRLVFDPADEEAEQRAKEKANGESVEVTHVLTEDPRTGERLHLGAAAPLVEMLTALGMDDAHLVRGCVNPAGPQGVAAWLWATRLRSTHQHVTRGILRPAGGTQAEAHDLTQRVLAAERSASGITVQQVQVQGTDVVVETGHESSSEGTGWADLLTFYQELGRQLETGLTLPEGE